MPRIKNRMIVHVNVEAIWSNQPNFPWTKFATLMRRTEVHSPQLEDGTRGDTITPNDLQSRGFHNCLFMMGPKSLGFVSFDQRGQIWAGIHVGFKPEVMGYVKLNCVNFAITQMFRDTTIHKVTAMIPSFNRPARVMARRLGFVPEGRVTEAFLREKEFVDLVLYGVTRDVFPVRERPKGQQPADYPAELAQSSPN